MLINTLFLAFRGINLNSKKQEKGPSFAILYWPLSTRGLIMDSYFATILGLFIEAEGRAQLIPCVIRLKCKLISSREIIERTRILNVTTDVNNPLTRFFREKHCGVDLTSMNEFRQSYVHDIDLYNDFEFESLSDAFEMYSIRFDNLRVIFCCEVFFNYNLIILECEKLRK